jgi:uncharacterized protein YggE
MKKMLLFALLVTSTVTLAQEGKQVPQITVSGEGKIKVVPDQAVITVSVESIGKEASEVKKNNDKTVDTVIKAIKKRGIPIADYQTQQVSLHKNYDYGVKKYNYRAYQTISIHLKDMSRYEDLMVDLIDSGINAIQGVEFKSSKIEALESEARRNAILNAKKKALDYTTVLNQKVGKAILISDNSQTHYPQPIYREVMMTKMADASVPNETLAVGEIEISANVAVTFELE